MTTKIHKIKLSCLAVILLICGLNLLSAQATYVIPDTFPEQPLDAYILVYEDSTQRFLLKKY